MSNGQLKVRITRSKDRKINSFFGDIFYNENCGLEKRRKRMLKKQKKKK